jgi:hypothetical protein
MVHPNESEADVGNMAHETTKTTRATPSSETRLRAVPANAEHEREEPAVFEVAEHARELADDIDVASDAIAYRAEVLDNGLDGLAGMVHRLAERARELAKSVEAAKRAWEAEASARRLEGSGVKPGAYPGLEGALELFGPHCLGTRRRNWSPAAIALAVEAGEGTDVPVATWVRLLDMATAGLEERARTGTKRTARAGRRG